MTLKDIAEKIFFVGARESEILEHWDYRKGKGADDIRKAYRKAVDPKNGHLKVEIELEMFELYLKDVLKKKRVKKQK